MCGTSHNDGRDAVLIYAGDFDPSGEDIARDFVERTDCLRRGRPGRGDAGADRRVRADARCRARSDCSRGGFIARHGQLVQVEVEAVHPDALRQLYQDAIDEHWDTSTYQSVRTQEDSERGELEAVLERFEDE